MLKDITLKIKQISSELFNKNAFWTQMLFGQILGIENKYEVKLGLPIHNQSNVKCTIKGPGKCRESLEIPFTVSTTSGLG